VTGWLLDTNVLSELRRPKPEPKVVAFVAAQPLELLYVSAVTLAEIRFGIERVTDVTKRAELNDWLAHRVRPTFDQRVLPVTEDVMFKWRLLVEEGAGRGIPFRRPTSSSPRRLCSMAWPSCRATRATTRRRGWPCSIRGRKRPQARGARVEPERKAGAVQSCIARRAPCALRALM